MCVYHSLKHAHYKLPESREGIKEEEEKRPENVGNKITIDYKRRVVMKDDVVIDSWSPNNHFQPRGPR